jgi:hypothetical protein
MDYIPGVGRSFTLSGAVIMENLITAIQFTLDALVFGMGIAGTLFLAAIIVFVIYAEFFDAGRFSNTRRYLTQQEMDEIRAWEESQDS